MASEGVVSEVVSEKPVQEETGELSDEQCPGPLKLREESSGNSTDNAGLDIDEKVKTVAMLNVIKVGDLENIDCGALIRTAHQSIPRDSSEESKAVQSIVPGNLEYSEGGDFIEAPLNIHASLDKISKDINAGLDEEKQCEIGKEMIKSDTLWQNDNIGEMEKKDESTERGHSSDANEKAACDATLARQRSREWSSKHEKGAKLQYAKALEVTSKEGITGDNVEEVPALAVKDLDCLNLQKEKVEDEMAFSKDNLKNEECNKMEVFEINKEDLNSHIDLMCEKIVITESLLNIKYETSDAKIERKESGKIEHLEGDLHISQCSTKVTLQEDEGQKIEVEELPDSLPEEIFLASTGISKTTDETIADRTTPDETFQSDEIVAELQATSGGIHENESAIVLHLVGEVEHKQDQEVSSTAGKDVDGSADEDKKKQGSSEIEPYMQDITKNDNELDMETEKSKGRDLCEDHKLEHGKKVSKSIDADRTSENVSVQEDEAAELGEQQSFGVNQEIITLSDDDLNEGTTDAIKSDTSSSAQSTVEKCLLNEHEENEKLAATAEMIQEEDKFHKDKDLDEVDTQVNECKTLQGSDSHSEESAKLTGPDYEPSQTGTQEDAGLSTIESSAREKMDEGDPNSNTEKCIDTVGYEEGNMKVVTQRDEGDGQKHDNHLETLSFGDEAAEGHTYTEKEHIHKEPNCSKILETKTQEEETGGDKHEQEADEQITDYHESSKIENLSEQTSDAYIKEEKREDLTILEQENKRINDLKEEDVTHEDPVDKSNARFPVTHESVGKTLEEEEDMMQKEVPWSDTEEAIHETTNINMIVGTGCEHHEKPPVETPATFGRTEENESTSDTHLKEQAEPGRDQEASSAVSKDAGGITDEDTQKKVYSEIELCTEDISKDDRELSVQDDEILVPHEHLPFNKNEEIVILVGEEVMKGGETDVIKFETSSSVRSTEDKWLKNEHQENEKLAAKAEMIQEEDQSDRVMDLNEVDGRAKKCNALCVSDSQAEKSSANIGVDYRQSQTDTQEDGSLTTIASSERNKMVRGALKSNTKNDKPVEGDEEGNLKAVIPIDERDDQKLDNYQEPLSFGDDAAGGTYIEKEHIYKKPKCSEVLETITQEDEREGDKLEKEADKQALDDWEGSKQDNLSEETNNAHLKKEKIKEGTIPEEENKRTDDLQETDEEHTDKSNALLSVTHDLVEETLEEIGTMQKGTPRPDTEQAIYETTNIHMTIEAGCKKHEKYPTKLRATIGRTEDNESSSDTTLTEQVAHVRDQKDTSTLPKDAGESLDEAIQNKCCSEMEPCAQDISNNNRELDTQDDQIEMPHENISFSKNQETITIAGDEGIKEETTDTIKFETSSSPQSTEEKCLGSEHQENEKLAATAEVIQEEDQFHKDEDLCEVDSKANECNNLWGSDFQGKESSNSMGADHEPSQADTQEDGSLTTIGSSAREKMNGETPRPNTEKCKDTYAYEEGNLKAVTQCDEEDSEPLPLTDAAATARGDTYTEKEHTCKESDCSKIPETNTQEEEEERDKLREEANEKPPEIQESSKPENVDRETKTAHMKEEKSQDAVTLEQESKRINDLMEESITREEHPAKSDALLPENHESVEKTLEEEEDIMQREAPKSNNEENFKAVTQSDEEDSEPLPLTYAAATARGDTYTEKEHTSKESDCSKIPETNTQEEEEEHDKLQEEANEQPPEIQESSKPENVDQETKTAHMKEEKSQDAVTLEQESKRINDLKEESITREEHPAKCNALLPENHESVEKTPEEEEDIMQREAPKSDNEGNLKAVTQSDEQDSEPLPLRDAADRRDAYTEKEHTYKESDCSKITETNTNEEEEEEEGDKPHKEANEQPLEIQESSKPENVDQEIKNAHMKEEKSQGMATLEQESKRTNDLKEESIAREEHPDKSDALLPENHELVKKTLEEEEDSMQKEAPKSDNERNLKAATQSEEDDSEPLPVEDAAARRETHTEKKHKCKESDCSQISETDTKEEEEEGDKLPEEANEQPREIQESSKPENEDQEIKNVHMEEEKSQDVITLEQEIKRINDLKEESITHEEHPAKNDALLPENHESVEKTLEEEEDIMQQEAPKSVNEGAVHAIPDIHMTTGTGYKNHEMSPVKLQATFGRTEENESTSDTHLKEQDESARDQEVSLTVSKDAGGSTDEDTQNKAFPKLSIQDTSKDDKELNVQDGNTVKPHAHLTFNKNQEIITLVGVELQKAGTTDAIKFEASSSVQSTKQKFLLNEHYENEKLAATAQMIQEEDQSHIDMDVYEVNSHAKKCNTLCIPDSQSENRSENLGANYKPSQTVTQEDGSLTTMESSERENLNQVAPKLSTEKCECIVGYEDRNLKAVIESDEGDGQKLHNHQEPLSFEDNASEGGSHTEKEHTQEELKSSKNLETSTQEEERGRNELEEEADEQTPDNKQISKLENLLEESKTVSMKNEKSQDGIVEEQVKKATSDFTEENIANEEHIDKSNVLLPSYHQSVKETLEEEVGIMQKEVPSYETEEAINGSIKIHMVPEAKGEKHEKSPAEPQATLGRIEENETDSVNNLTEEVEHEIDQEGDSAMTKEAVGSIDGDSQIKSSSSILYVWDILKDDRDLDMERPKSEVRHLSEDHKLEHCKDFKTTDADRTSDKDETVVPHEHSSLNKSQEITSLVSDDVLNEGTSDAIKLETSSRAQSTQVKYVLNEQQENEKLAAMVETVQEKDKDLYEMDRQANKCNTLWESGSQAEKRSKNMGTDYEPPQTDAQEYDSLSSKEPSAREKMNQEAQSDTKECNNAISYEEEYLKAVPQSDERDGQKLENYLEPLPFGDEAAGASEETEKEHIYKELNCSKILETSTKEKEGDKLEEEGDEQIPDNQKSSKLQNLSEETKNENSQYEIGPEQKKNTNDLKEESITYEDYSDKSIDRSPVTNVSVEETMEEVGIIQKEASTFDTEETFNDTSNIHMTIETMCENHEKSLKSLCSEQDHGITTDKESTMNDTPSYNAKLDKGTLSSSEIEQNENKKWDEEHIHESENDDEGQERNIELSSVAVTVMQDNDKIGYQKYQQSSISEYEWTHETEEQTCIQVLEARSTNGTKFLAEDAQDNVPQITESGTKQPENSFGATKELKLAIQKQHDRYVEGEILVKQEQSSQEEVGVGQNLEEVVVDMHPRNETEKTADHAELDNASETKIMHESNLHDNAKDLPVTPGLVPVAVNTEVDKINEATPLLCEANMRGNKREEITEDDIFRVYEKYSEGSECGPEDKNQEMAYETGVTVIKNAGLSPLQIFEEEIVKKVSPPVEAQVQTNKETETSIHNQELEEEGTTNKQASAAITEQNILEDEKVEKDSEVVYKERPEIVAIHNIEEERAKQENSYTSIEEDLSKVSKKFEMPAEDVTSEKRTIKDEGASTDIDTMTMGHPTLEQSFKKGEIEAKYEEETCENKPNVIEKVSEKAKDVMEMGVPNEEVESDFIPLAQGLKQTADKESAKGSTTDADGITIKINSREDESCGQLSECGKILYAVDTEELPSIHLKDNQRNMADESYIAMTRRTENKEVEETKVEADETEPVKIELSDDNDTHDKTDENQIDGTIGSYKEFIQNHEKSSRIEVSDAKTLSDDYGNNEMDGSSSSQERSDENSCLTLSESGNDIHHKNKAEDIKENILEKEASTEVHEVASISELSKEMFQSEEKREKRLEEEETQQEHEPNSNTADEIPTGQVEESVSKPSKHNPDSTDSEKPMKVRSLEIVCDEVEKSADLLPGLSHEAVFGGKRQTQFEPEKARDGESIDEIEGLGTTSADSETSVTMIEDGEHEAEACRSLLTEQSVENTNTQKVDESKELPEPNPVSKCLFENKEIRKTIDEIPSMNVHLSSHTDVATEQITSEEMEEELVVSKKNKLSSVSDDISGAEISDEAKDPKMTSADLLSPTVIDTEYAKEVSSASAVPMSLREAIGQKGHGKEQAEEFSLIYSEKTKQNFNLNEDNEFDSKSLEPRPPSKNSKSLEHNLEMVSSSEEIQIKEYWDKAQNKSTTAELCADDTMSAEVSNKFEKGYDSPPELPKDEDAKGELFQDIPSTTSTALFEEHIHENTISDEENKNFSLEGIKSASGSVKDEKVETPSSTSAPINITHITNQRYESASDVGHYASTVKRELGGALAYNNDGKQHLKASIVVFNEQTENVDSQEITMSEKQSEFLGCKQVSVAEKLVFEETEVMKSTEDENHELATFETSQNDQDKQMDVSYLPVSQFLIDRIMRGEDEKSQIMIQGIEDGCEGVDNTKQELNLSSDKHRRIEECITQNITEVPKSYDAQESPIDEGELKSNISSFPAMETLVEDAKKEVFLSKNLTDIIPKNDDKHATTEKGETQSELKNGEFIGLGPRSHEKSDGVDEVTERKVTLNDNRALIENPDTPSVAKTDSNKILQEESCPKSVDAIEIQPSIEMLEKATIEEHPPETRVTIETKNFIGIDENLLKTRESSRSVLEVNQVLGDASEFAPEGKEVMTKVVDKHDGITDAQIEGQIERTKLSDSGKAHPSESLTASTDDSNQIAESILEEKRPAINRDELNKEVTDTQAGIDETKSFIGIDETLLKNQETLTPVLEVNQVPQDDLELAPEGKELKTQMDDKHDGDTQMDTTTEGPTDRTKSSDSDKAHLPESEKDSIDDIIQIAESILKEKNLAVHRDELNKDVMDMQVADEKSDEEDEKDAEEHEFDKSGTDDPVTVETRDQEPKTAHKKSHNILSGVKSKVKHSIAKVKKAITGKSSHSKTMSPK